MSVDAPPAEQVTWHRLSRRMLLVHPVVETMRVIPALAGLLFAGGHDAGNVVVTLALTAVVVVLGLTRWFTTWLRISAHRVELRHGLLRRRTIATARDRIRTVDVTAHPMHRLLGLARVVIGTGTNDRKGGGRIVLDGLRRADADALRSQLLHRPQGRTAAGPVPIDATISVDEPESELDAGTTVIALNRRWIGYAPFTLSGILTGFVLWGFFSRVQNESHVDVLRWGPLRAAADAVRRLPTVSAVGVVTGVVVAFIAVTSTVGYVLAYWNFRLVRHRGGMLQVTRGLITTRATSVERRRLVGVEISEPLLLRAVGGARASVVATGLHTGRGAERGGEVLLPPAPLRAVRQVATDVLDGSRAVVAEVGRHGRFARRRRLTRAVAAALVGCAGAAAAGAAGAPWWLPALGISLVVLSVPLALDRFASLGHATIDGYLVTRSGSLVRRRATLATGAVIGWNLRSSVTQRRVGLATLTATTAAGAQGYSIVDLDAARAVALADAVTPGLLGQFSS